MNFKIEFNIKGPLIIENYLKKKKNITSIGKIFSSYNKRLFTLNLEKKILFYNSKSKNKSQKKEIELNVKNLFNYKRFR